MGQNIAQNVSKWLLQRRWEVIHRSILRESKAKGVKSPIWKRMVDVVTYGLLLR
jgi:hypothetical protein